MLAKDRQRFESFIDKSTDCWNWNGYLGNGGYGRFQLAGKKFLAHRLMYWDYYGIGPNGFCVMHSCDNRECVNPEHLSLGTYKDNSKDASGKGRLANQKTTHCPKGHEYNLKNTYLDKPRNKRQCRECNKLRSRDFYFKNKKPLKAKNTHCGFGHEFTKENTYLRKDTQIRQCRECSKIRDRRYYKEKKVLSN